MCRRNGLLHLFSGFLDTDLGAQARKSTSQAKHDYIWKLIDYCTLGLHLDYRYQFRNLPKHNTCQVHCDLCLFKRTYHCSWIHRCSWQRLIDWVLEIHVQGTWRTLSWCLLFSLKIYYMPPASWNKLMPSSSLGMKFSFQGTVGENFALHPNGLKWRTSADAFPNEMFYGVLSLIECETTFMHSATWQSAYLHYGDGNFDCNKQLRIIWSIPPCIRFTKPFDWCV